MTVVWIIGGLVAWLILTVTFGRITRAVFPRDGEAVVIFGFFWPITIPLMIALSPLFLAYWLITKPTKAERLAERRETEKWEASKRARRISEMERELGIDK